MLSSSGPGGLVVVQSVSSKRRAPWPQSTTSLSLSLFLSPSKKAGGKRKQTGGASSHRRPLSFGDAGLRFGLRTSRVRRQHIHGVSSRSWPDQGLSLPTGRVGYFECLGKVRALDGSQKEAPTYACQHPLPYIVCIEPSVAALTPR